MVCDMQSVKDYLIICAEIYWDVDKVNFFVFNDGWYSFKAYLIQCFFLNEFEVNQWNPICILVNRISHYKIIMDVKKSCDKYKL